MALIKCHECKHQVSDKAVACLKCGAPIRAAKVNRFMDNGEELFRFRKQYDDFDWKRLNSHIEFKEAIAADDIDKAGLIADRILIGETKSIVEARKIKKVHNYIKSLPPDKVISLLEKARQKKK